MLLVPSLRGEGPAAATGPAGIQALTEEGIRLLEGRDYHGAIRSLERVLELKPGFEPARAGVARAHAGLGVEFINTGELRKGREAFERALRTAEDGIARFGLGYVDFMEGRDRTARDNLERALARDAQDPRAHKLLALLDYRAGQTTSALKRMEEAARLDPADRESQALRAQWAREATLREKLLPFTTRHFSVLATPAIHPDAVREILVTLEAVHDSIGGSLGHWPRRPVSVLLLEGKEFQEATGSHHWVGGVYDGQIKVPVDAAEAKPRAPRPTLLMTLRHEYAHVVVKELCPGCPNWLNEGIAQYFELEEAADGSPGAEARTRRKARLREELLHNRGSRLALEKIPARLYEVSDPALARWSYLEGLGFVTYLAEKHRPFRLRLLLAAISREGSVMGAFQATYGSPLAELETSWWSSL